MSTKAAAIRHAVRERAKYAKRKGEGWCVDNCGTKLAEFRTVVRCKACRAIRAERERQRRATDEGRIHRRNRKRALYAKRKTLGLCLHHGNERPCLLCSEQQKAKRPPSQMRCGRCDQVGHRRDSFLCPMRFRVDVTEYALARRAA